MVRRIDGDPTPQKPVTDSTTLRPKKLSDTALNFANKLAHYSRIMNDTQTKIERNVNVGEKVLDKYKDTPGFFGDVERLVSGEMTQEDFLKKYPVDK